MSLINTLELSILDWITSKYSNRKPSVIICNVKTAYKLFQESISKFHPNRNEFSQTLYRGIKIVRTEDIEEGVFEIY